MKTKILLITILILLSGFGVFIFISQMNTNESSPMNHPFSNINHTDNEHIREKSIHDNKQETPTNEENAPTKNFKGAITEAFKDTVAYFSNKEMNIVAIGDSLTQGVGDSTKQGGYVGILDNTINQNNQVANFYNFGHRGDRTDQLRKRLDNPKVSSAIQDADIILITIGANDIMQVLKDNITNLTLNKFREERVHYEARLRDIFSEIRRLNADANIFLIGFYNPYDKYFKDIKELAIIVDEWNGTGEAITEELENVAFIPTSDLFDKTDKDLIAEDNFHPNNRGYQLMAKRVLMYLTKQER